MYTRPCSSLNKVKQNLCCGCFCFLEIFLAWKFGMGFLGGHILVQGFFGFVWSPRDFFGFWFLFLFDHPCHIKSGDPHPTPPPTPSGFRGHVMCQNFTLIIVTSSYGHQFKLWVLSFRCLDFSTSLSGLEIFGSCSKKRRGTAPRVLE